MFGFPTRAVSAVPPLEAWRDRELAGLFATLEPARSADRAMRGRLFALPGSSSLPRVVARSVAGVVHALNPWRGKAFSHGSGSNRWLWLRGVSFGHFRISDGTGPDGGPSLWLDYDIDANPKLLRRIRGEARQLDDGRLLCRMLWKLDNGYRTLLWFTLERGDRDAG